MLICIALFPVNIGQTSANIGVDAPTAHYDASAEFMGIGVLYFGSCLGSFFDQFCENSHLYPFTCQSECFCTMQVSAGITANIADFGIYIDAEVGGNKEDEMP